MLHEDNWDEWYEDHPDADPEVDVPDFAENILPGTKIEKAPYVENTGNNDAYVFLTVETPAREINNFSAGEDGTVEIGGDILDIDVKAYAIQTRYITDGVETPDAVWTKYVNNNGGMEGMFGAEREANPSLYEIFDILVNGTIEDEDGNTSEGLVPGFNDSWAQIGDVYQADGKNVYVFKYNVNGGLVSPEAESAPLFDAVRLNTMVGEPQPVVINYYANNDILDDSSSSGTGAGEDDTESAAPEITGYTLVNSKLSTLGSAVGSMYYGDDIANDRANTTYTDNATGERICADDIVNSNVLNILIDQTGYEELDNVIPQEYYVYEIVCHSSNRFTLNFVGIHEDYFIANEGNTEFNRPVDIVVPNSITPTEIKEVNNNTFYYLGASSTSSDVILATLKHSISVKTDAGYFVSDNGTQTQNYTNKFLGTTLDITRYIADTGCPICSFENSYVEITDSVYNLTEREINCPDGYKYYMNKYSIPYIYQKYYDELSVLDDIENVGEYNDALVEYSSENFDILCLLLDTLSVPGISGRGVSVAEYGLLVSEDGSTVKCLTPSMELATGGLNNTFINGCCENFIIRNSKESGNIPSAKKLSVSGTVYLPSACHIPNNTALRKFDTHALRVINWPVERDDAAKTTTVTYTGNGTSATYHYKGTTQIILFHMLGDGTYVIPEEIKEIKLPTNSQTVYIHSSLETLNIPSTCKKLNTIYYEGSAEEFAALGATVPSKTTVLFNQDADTTYQGLYNGIL